MNNLLSLRRLFRVTGLLIIGIVFGAVLCSNLAKISLASVIPGIGDYGLGISVSNDKVILPDANPLSRPFVYATHKVSVKSPYHMGYRLTVLTYGTQTVGGSMYGQPGNFIRPVQDGKNLAPDSWGYTISDSQSNEHTINDVWHNVPQDGYGREISSDHGWQPGDDNIDEQYITYGANIGWNNHPDSYVANIKYTVTPQEPTAPAILRIDDGGDCLIGEACQLQLTGVQLEKINRVGVDFNGNDSMDDVEACSKWTIDPQYQYTASCELPQFDSSYIDANNVAGADEFGGVFQLLIDSNDGTMNSGHQITYRYQPRIDSVEVLNSESGDTLKVKDSVGVIDMTSTDSASMMLTDDGDVYLWGNTPIYDGSQKVFDKTMAPMMVRLPDLTHADAVVDIAGYANSYYAISHQGYLYAWGDNSAQQLPLQDSYVGWFTQPVASSYYGPKQTGYKRFARQIMAGSQFGVTLNTMESGQLMSSWGRNDLKQLGQDDTNATFVPGAVVQDSKYRPVVGESYAYMVAGREHVLALTSYGRVLSWGAHGEAGGGDNRLGFKTEDDAGHPHDITYDDDDKDKNYLRAAYHDEDKTFIDIAAGDNFSMALAQGREGDDKTYLYTFGANDRGQLGKGGGSSEHRAYEISDLFQLGDEEQIVGITASGKSAAAWTNYGSLYVWGDNANGRLGAVGDAMLSAPTRVPNVNNVDDAVLGIVNYAHTTTGRVVTWGGSYENFLPGSAGDITDWLTNPTYLIKVTGRHLNLAVADTWVDFNDNGLMDELERPLAKSCDETSCYLQISTLGIAGGDINTNGYSVRVVTAVNTNHAGASNDDVKLKAARQLARNATRVTVEKPITKRQAKSNDTDDSSETEASSIEGADEMANAVVDKDEASSSDDTSNADDAEKAGDEKIDVDDGENGSSDIGDNADNVDEDDNLDESNNGNNTDQSGCKITVNDDCGLTSECVECVSDEQCECACTCDNDGCTDHNEADRDDSKTDGVCMFVGHGLDADNLSIDDHVNKDLVSSFSSGAQIQLIDGRRKGCFDSVGSINVDD